ncbi:hypothetical protein YC2023_118821 [Brassica napus]
MIRKDVVTLTFRALTEKRNREKWWNQSGNFFAALFLASIGMLIHMHFLWNHVDILVAAVLLVIVIKTVVVAVVVKVFPYNNRTAVLSKLYLCFWGQLLKAWYGPVHHSLRTSVVMNDETRITSIVNAILQPDLNRIDGDISAVVASVKEVSGCSVAYEAKVIATVEGMLKSFKTEIMASRSRVNTQSPGESPKIYSKALMTNKILGLLQCKESTIQNSHNL